MVQRARQRVLAVEAVDPRLQRAHGAAERVDRAGEDADRVAAAPAQRRPGLARGDEQGRVREPLDGGDDHAPRRGAEADEQQQRAADGGEEHLPVAGGPRGGVLRQAEVELERGGGAVVERHERVDHHPPVALLGPARLLHLRVDGTIEAATRSGCTALRRCARLRRRAALSRSSGVSPKA